ncbi:MAG TPA: phospholipase A2 [Xanthomonadaceae bacterium]|jgi:RHS repeat-associated protein
MARWCIGWILLLLLAGNALAGQKVATYYVDNRWNGSNEASLPHLRSVGEGCISTLRNDMRTQQKNHPNAQWRYRLLGVGEDDGFDQFSCTGYVDELVSGIWQPIDSYGQQNAYVAGLTASVSCTISALIDPETGQCGPRKCCLIPVGNPVDVGTGDKQQVDIDYAGAGAFPLRFERTYDSSRTWLNQPVPVGVAWMHSYLASIYFMPATGASTTTQAVAYRPDGSILRFNLVGGVWTPDNDVAVRLSATIDGNGIPTATLTNTDDSVEKYDGIGRLTSITNRDGLTQTLSYVTPGGNYANDVQKVTDPQGHTLAFGYNTSGQLTSLTDGNGAIIQYTYDTAGNLATVVYPDVGGTTKTRTYSYNEAGQVAVSWPNALTGITDENSQRYASWGYDSQGRAVLSVHGPYTGGTIDKTVLTFNSNGTTGFTDALGQARTYGFTVKFTVAHPASLDVACDSCSARDKSRGYDANGYPNASTDFDGNQATYAFAALDGNSHPRGLETQRVEGIPPTSSSDTSAKRTINTQWASGFRVPTQQDVIDNSGTTPTTVQTTKWAYNGRGQPLFRCLIDPNVAGATSYTCGSQTNAPTGVRQWAWTYCESGGGCPLIGQVLTAKGPRTDVNDTTTYAYYASDDSTCATAPTTCPHRIGDLQTVTDALGHVTTYTTYDADGRPIRILDANGVPTEFAYHPRGWPTQRAVRYAATGTSTNDRITTWTYDGVGQVKQVTHPVGDYEIFGYDNAHRLTDVTNRMSEHLHYVLDDAGDRKEEDFHNSGNTIKHKALRDYNVLGRLQDTKNANAGVSALAMSYLYDGNGNVQTATDGRNHVTNNTYDPRNRLVKLDQAADLPAQEAFTNYAYDALDHLSEVTDPQGLHTYYSFDGLDNQTGLDSPDTGITTYGYDAAGNRTSQVDARVPAVTTIYTYDALNRPTHTNYPATPSLDVTYTWDTPATGCVSPNRLSLGRMSTVADGSGSTTFCYNRFGDTTKKTQTVSGAAFPVSYAYGKDGRPTSETEPNGTIVSYARDNNDRIKIVKYQLSGQSSATSLVSAVAYSPFGPANTITYRSGANVRTLSRSYDLDYVIQGVVDGSSVGDGLNLTYSRDAVGNLTQIKTSATTGNKFVYDGLNRLTQANDLSGNHLWRYTYDTTGNRMTEQQGTLGVVAYTYDPNGSHHLWDVGTTARQYDGAGNTLSIGAGVGGQGFHYDDTDRMDQFSLGGVLKKQYLTNALGQRVMKSKAGDTSQTVKTVYDESGHRLGDFNNSNATIAEYLWMDDLPVGVLDGASNTVKSIEPDHLGTPRVVIDAASNLAIWNWSILGEPFGLSLPTNLNGSTLALNLRFPGQTYDAESGMDYNYFRDYDSGTGRYVESDPIGLLGGISTYSYAKLQPLEQADMTGLGEICGSGITNRLVPDNPFHFPFKSCCAEHDNCYGCSGKLSGVSKQVCDDNFGACLHHQCEGYSGAQAVLCNRLAGAYYEAVHLLGGKYFKKARKGPCCGPPSP